MRRLPALVAALVLLLVACAVACAGSPPTPPAPPRQGPLLASTASPPPEPRVDGRLPPLAAPISYALRFDVDPRSARFSGSARIEIAIPAATSTVILHGHGLHVTQASVISGADVIKATASTRLAAVAKVPEELVLSLARPLAPGRATLSIDWDAPFDDELSGLYRVQDGERWYAFSQFEATDARRAFPCFDEPSFKVPFEVTVTVPRGMIAVSNTPEVERHDEGEATTFRFAPTPPLPSYLVALAAGDLDVREAPRSRKPAIRLIAPKGKGDMGALALEATGALVDALGDWFGIPYPFEKLDIVAVPDFAAGAMENPGLVTFRKELLLLDPSRASVRIRRAQATVIAHELAHQWFGNLVTAAWWDDLWLNEGMATWMESRIVESWRPTWGARLDAVYDGLGIMDLDSLASARAVREPVVSTSDALEAFDGITYEKGAAVLSTIERWVGEETFRRGVREYLKDSAWQSVHADKLMSALDRASGKDVTRMAASFLDRPGVPVVEARLSCERGARWNVELSQEPWRPLGSKASEDPSHTWVVPVCVLAEGEKKSTCADLTQGAPSLVAGRGCPRWVHPNADAGYYRFSLPEAEIMRMAASRGQLGTAQRLSLLSNAWAAVRAGTLEPGAMLRILPLFDEDGARQIVGLVATILTGMSDVLVEDDARPGFRKFSLARLGKRKKDLGWAPKKDEPAGGDETIVRRTLLAAMGDIAEDEATLKEAEEVAARWLADPTSVDADVAAVALDLASRRAGEPRLEELRAAAKRAKTDEDRITALRAMGGFDDRAVLGKALDVVLTEEVKTSDVRYLLGAAFGRRRARALAEEWVRTHWDELRKKLPGSLSAGLVRAAGLACTKAEVEARASFYTPRAADIEGAPRALAEALEGATLCAELRTRGAAAMARGLAKQR